MFEAEFFAGVCEGVGAVGCAVVGEQGLDVDAEPGVIRQSRMEEVQHRIRARQSRKDFGTDNLQHPSFNSSQSYRPDQSRSHTKSIPRRRGEELARKRSDQQAK